MDLPPKLDNETATIWRHALVSVPAVDDGEIVLVGAAARVRRILPRSYALRSRRALQPRPRHHDGLPRRRACKTCRPESERGRAGNPEGNPPGDGGRDTHHRDRP